MQIEVEAKFVKVDHDILRRKLKELDAVCEQPMRLMRRAVFDSDAMQAKDAFLRVRDEGHRVTITYKQFDDENSIYGVKEIETSAGDFAAAVAILEQTGLVKKSYQETKRETWRLGDVEVVLDEWPWIKPFVEIEGPDEGAVRRAAEQLGFDFETALFGGVASVYLAEYAHLGSGKAAADIINQQLPIIRFEDMVPKKLLQPEE